MKRAILRDSGWKAEVIILEDKSNEEQEKFKVQVVKTLRKSLIFGYRPDGDVFELSSVREYSHYKDWDLELIEE